MRGISAAKVHRTFFTLSHLSAPQLAQLIEPADELIETEAARIVADFQLVQLVDVDLDEAALVRRRLLLDAGEELVVFVLQLPEVFFELIELIVLFDHEVAVTIRAFGAMRTTVDST